MKKGQGPEVTEMAALLDHQVVDETKNLNNNMNTMDK